MSSNNTASVRRRTVLSTAGAAAIGSLAGCLSLFEGDDDGNDDSDDNSSDGTSDGSDGPLTDYSYTEPPQIVPLAEQGYESTLRTVNARHELVTEGAAGGPWDLPEVWAWQADDRAPSVPGPIYRMEEGETLELTYDNSEHDRPHTVHVHSVSKSWRDDGAPVANRTQVGAGESHTYTLTGDTPGTHLYHCHYQTHTHLDMGMYGIFRVDPAGYEAPDREYFLTLRDWDTRIHDMYAGGDAEYDTVDRTPNAFTINGRCAPSTFHPELGSPLIVSEGETMRIHVGNNGYEAHPFHTHGHQFTVVEKNGGRVPDAARQQMDVVNVPPAGRVTLEIEADADPGIYPAHCHKVNHVTNDGSYPGGMATAIVYESAMETDEFAEIMDDAGFEG